MKKVLGKLFVIIAILVIAFPFVSRHELSKMNKDISHNYYKTDISQNKKDEKLKAKDEYNKSLLYGAFNSAGEIESLKLPKAKLLSKDLEPIGVLYIPKLDEDIPVYMGTTDDVLTIGVGIVENTSIPGGIGTNSVISGHRGTHNGDFFLHLDKMENGDNVYYVSDGDILKYTTYKTDIVQPDAVSSINIDPDMDQITLLTCTPYLINTERLLVFTKRSTLTEEDRKLFADKFSNDKQDNVDVKDMEAQANKMITIYMIILLIILVFLIILLPYVLKRNKQSHKL